MWRLWLGSLTLVWAQNFGIGTTTPTERLDVEGGRLRVRAYSGTGTRIASVDPNGVFGTIAGNNAGDVLQWNGTAWVPAAVSTTTQTTSPLQGNGTAGNPITFRPGTQAGQVWAWDGDSWELTVPTAATSAPLQGNGTPANPITFRPGTQAGQVWAWDGDSWELTLPTAATSTSAPLQGNGTPADPIALQSGTQAGQILFWNGTSWTLTQHPVRNGLTFATNPSPAIELGGALTRNTDIPLSGFNLTLSGNTGNVGIGTNSPNPSARLEISASNAGLLIPRVNLTSVTDATTIPNPATSLLVYNTNAALPAGTGYYYNAGTPAAPRWVSINNEVVWYHRSSTGAITLNNNLVLTLPGLSQVITIPPGYTAEVEIWAQAGVALTGGVPNSWALVDVIIYRNGNFIPVGGWNRRKLHNGAGDVTDMDALVVIARETLGPGTYTYEVRGTRPAGNQEVAIGGDCVFDVNCGELKIAVRYRPQ
ncbi:MAG: hypothetical protein NZ958_05420 [Bacteroidia bacterium]|nr:hypothetical protein [Bacteroidia bacterium]MDW8088979.1 hypothetical protein [Bacteroidia bacterium]